MGGFVGRLTADWTESAEAKSFEDEGDDEVGHFDAAIMSVGCWESVWRGGRDDVVIREVMEKEKKQRGAEVMQVENKSKVCRI